MAFRHRNDSASIVLNMSRFSQAINNFAGHLSDILSQDLSMQVSKIQQSYSSLRSTITESDPAIVEMKKIAEARNNVVFPAYIRIGTQKMYGNGTSLNNIELPLLIPVEKQNAILFDVEDAMQRDVAPLLQQVAYRIMLQMSPHLCRFHFIDANFGGSFGGLMHINKNIASFSYSSSTEVNNLISEISKVLVDARQSYQSQYSSLSDYNANEPKLAKPFNMVFIDDFPACFSANALSDLRKFINRGNASKAGVFIFVNYSKRRAEENGVLDMNGFDIQEFKKACTCIELDGNSRITISGGTSIYTIPDGEVWLDSSVPEKGTLDTVINLIGQKKPKKADISLDNWIDELKEKSLIWSGSTAEGIDVPVGYSISEPGKMFNFYIANDNDSNCKDYFSLVAGNPGYGKTVLLHNIIVNACMKYSPEELELYLVDFANGASFSMYKRLPHAKALMLANNREYALRVLKAMEQEASHRADLYQAAEDEYGKYIGKLAEYRSITGECIPRILVVMDEFHYLFTSSNPTIFEARETLINGIRQWRKFGISIILSTQSISGVNFGDANDYITYRFAFNLTGENSRAVLRNREAEHLVRKGQCLMNNSTDGDTNNNYEFQSAFTTKYDEHVAFLSEKYRETHNGTLPPRFICTSSPFVDLSSNADFTEQRLTQNKHQCFTYLGQPDLLRATHTRLCYMRREGSNTIILGSDNTVAVNTIALSVFQIKRQQSNSAFYLVDCTGPGDEYQHSFDDLPQFCDGLLVSNTDAISTVHNLLLSRREDNLKGIYHPESVYLIIFNMQNSPLFKADTTHGYPQPSPIMAQLLPIIKEGPALGIHCIVHSVSSNALLGRDGFFGGDGILSHFNNKVLMKGSDVEAVSMFERIKVSAIDTAGTMVVFNRRLDGEQYEQCKAYATLERQKITFETMSHFFTPVNNE